VADVPGLLGVPANGLAEAELMPGLHHVTVDARSALREYLRDETVTRLDPGPRSRAGRQGGAGA
jgi:hypothetical protein